eukprot:1186500-Prorocentrum_minimum.AAC.3
MPEEKAAKMLRKMMTFVAAKTVMVRGSSEEIEREDNEGSASSHPVSKEPFACKSGRAKSSLIVCSRCTLHSSCRRTLPAEPSTWLMWVYSCCVTTDGEPLHPSHDMRLTAVRIIEVRNQYAHSGFDWEFLQAALDHEIYHDTRRAKENFGLTIKELKEFWQ